jgi:hypothetical protein
MRILTPFLGTVLFSLVAMAASQDARAGGNAYSLPPCMGIGNAMNDANSLTAWSDAYCLMETTTSTTSSKSYNMPLPISFSVSNPDTFPNPATDLYVELDAYGYSDNGGTVSFTIYSVTPSFTTYTASGESTTAGFTGHPLSAVLDSTELHVASGGTAFITVKASPYEGSAAHVLITSVQVQTTSTS